LAQYFVVHPRNPQSRLIRLAAQALRDGGLIAYPTDSSYALGCRLDDAEPLRRLRDIRGLDERHELTLMCRDLADVGHFARLDNWQFRILRLGMPGSFTFLLPASREVPRRAQHARRNTIGVRVSDHAVVEALLAELDAPMLTSTLILPDESVPLNDPAEINARLGRQLDVVIDAGACSNEPTTVVDLAVDPPVLVRQGRGDPARLGLAPANRDGGGAPAGGPSATRVK
jgi:tRNA threonylcarbamoyl adenosine modification protein (Sua5/YciO/YrdC/YwlC family)